jgi:hypothetical protein
MITNVHLNSVSDLSVDSDIGVCRFKLFHRHSDGGIFGDFCFVNFAFEDWEPIVDVADGDVHRRRVHLIAVRHFHSQDQLD